MPQQDRIIDGRGLVAIRDLVLRSAGVLDESPRAPGAPAGPFSVRNLPSMRETFAPEADVVEFPEGPAGQHAVLRRSLGASLRRLRDPFNWMPRGEDAADPGRSRVHLPRSPIYAEQLAEARRLLNERIAREEAARNRAPLADRLRGAARRALTAKMPAAVP